ncbi:MAG TPA: hypothetical protein VES38_05180 [Methylotenera sp.]|nr:hypothetical protein [Methylotenera sp.]
MSDIQTQIAAINAKFVQKGARQTFGSDVHLVCRKQADGNWKAVTRI